MPLQELQGSVGRFADNGGERFMWKREFGGRRHFRSNRGLGRHDELDGAERVGDFPKGTVVVSDAAVVEGLCSSVDELNRDGA